MKSISYIVSALAVAGFAAGSTIPSQKLERRTGGGSCSSPAFELATNVGGQGSTAFCESEWGTTYTPISNFTVWAVEEDVVGIQATYADGSVSALYGRAATYKVNTIGVNYAADETWTALELYGSTTSGFIKHLRATNSNGDILNSGEPLADGITSYSQSVGAGILFGIQGTVSPSNGDLESLSFLFLASPISSIVIQNFEFSAGPTGNVGINIEEVDSGHYFDGSNQPTTWSFADSVTRTETYTFTQMTANTYSQTQGYTIMISLPIIGTIGGSTTNSFMWTTAYTTVNTRTTTRTVDITWTSGGTLQPGTGVDCVAEVGNGQGTYPYTCEVTLNLQNGQAYTFAENGNLYLNAFSQTADVEVTENDNP